jgi:signal transduction histidine kinase/CheY-like chemotaxis protein
MAHKNQLPKPVSPIHTSFRKRFFSHNSFPVRYGVAALAIIFMAVNYAAIDRLVPGGTPFLAFTPAVMLAAWFGGLGPGLFATVFGGLVGNYFWVDPPHTLVIKEIHELIHTLVFYVVGISISLMSRSMVRARAEAIAANQAKDHFLAVLSHELRNPLSPIVAAVGALEEINGLSEDARNDLTIIRRNVALQSRLIEDLLDANRVSHGKILLQFEDCNVHKVLERAIEVCQAEVLAKGLKLCFAPDARRYQVRADPARLQQVFWNLIRNAIKFTVAGRVTVRTLDVVSRPGDATGPVLLIQVEDTGLGIEMHDLSRIFEPFAQGAGDFPQRAGGLGLGLALSKALVELHGGVIRAASPGPGKGATFSVELPAIASLPAGVRNETPAPRMSRSIDAPTAVKSPIVPPVPAVVSNLEVVHGGESSAKHILLVEDEPDAGQLMLRLLKRSGYDVTLAPTAALAMKEVRERRIDLLISDIRLPDGSGIDLLRQIRSEQPLPRAICLSGYSSDTDLENTRDAGFEIHLVKPVDFRALRDAIDQPAIG